MADVKVCKVCGKVLMARRQLYCCHACRAEAKRTRMKAAYKPSGLPGLYREKVCPDCGVRFVAHIKSYRCKACQAAADTRADVKAKQRKAEGKIRLLGSTDNCQRCGKPYIVESGMQKYCLDCRAAADRDHHAKRMREINARPETKAARANRRKAEPEARTCCVCGKTFRAAHFALTCGPDCRAVHMAAYYAEYDAGRKDKKAAYNRERWASLTEKEREEINCRARELYRLRKGGKA